MGTLIAVYNSLPLVLGDVLGLLLHLLDWLLRLVGGDALLGVGGELWLPVTLALLLLLEAVLLVLLVLVAELLGSCDSVSGCCWRYSGYVGMNTSWRR